MEKYIVLRHHHAAGAADGDAAMTLAIQGSAGEERTISISTPELSKGEAAQLAMQSDTLIAPAMPLQLIDPVATPEATYDDAPSGVAWGLSAIGADVSPFDGHGVRVGILDTGIDINHECFLGVKLMTKDYTGEGIADTKGHGTHCAATIFGRDVDGIRVGVARGVTDVFIGKTLGNAGGDSGMLVHAINDAVDHGCSVISMSLGFDYTSVTKRLHEDGGLPLDLATAVALHRYRANTRMFDRLGAMLTARPATGQHEVLLIAASGNSSRRNVNPTYEMPVMPPSEADEFVSVGAVGRDSSGHFFVAPFSNINCTVCGPGVAVLSAQAGTLRGLVTKSGTSMAAPHVAGVAALHIQAGRAAISKASRFQMGPVFKARLLKGTSLVNFPPSVDERHIGQGLVLAPLK
ncbi:peptidase S8 and S53 subtilisin kexin sedolisin [Paracidovorax avenae ATCC 19860]|uniref:Peptidase S8 and S53 subtilisin kexin sedolisin n=1 Tax=Paracidovorax avenae (strain ATCC 19860 / DSM 7227 / CCUG 15838 / JCM 20985 / LMG 2117 / NCPPB 1011) TaxID=643561 RepID=F0QDF1_PARA1|nr:S8 family serine peptidase [Paracidovorax avenae]ADX46396.1 peptidase S8 and S53 subtilisin kexin sedolisin [Paracidovorax avenae ATCC 19860]